ncbi:MAG: phenylalanine--tRNA ligase subunit beta [Deltaproteobacteria bacterium]
MILSSEWLSRYISLPKNIDAVFEKLTVIGLEVERVQKKTLNSARLRIGEILDVQRHPAADRLSLCKVKTKERLYEIVCGAKNVKKGDKVIVALPGAELPNGMVIRETTIRNQRSEGMICSEQELGFPVTMEGILVLPGKTTLQDSVEELLSPRDIIFEINTPANRSDVLSFIGVARELSVAFHKNIRAPKVTLRETTESIQKRIKVVLKDSKKCPRYMGRLISNVTMGPSPEWLRRCLESVGQRSINNVVDITNFVMLEYGQPLHAFDFDEIDRGHSEHEMRGIFIRPAKEGERLFTLDGMERVLKGEDLVIADSSGPVALAGIMGAGGERSEISDSTKNIFLESAYFNPTTIRKTSKRLGLSSESSKRFERGVDIDGVKKALNRAAMLIADIAHGKLLRGEIDLYPRKTSSKKISLTLPRLNQYLGYEPKPSNVKNILQRLGIDCHFRHSSSRASITSSRASITSSRAKRGIWLCKIPGWRNDLSRDVDLIEEIARFEGYAKIPSQEPSGSPCLDQKIEEDLLLEKRIKEALLFCGFTEAIHYSFCSPRDLEKIRWQGRATTIQNPLGEEMRLLRPTLALSLLKTLRFNIDHQIRDVRIFELRSIFDENRKEIRMLSGLMRGSRYPLYWNLKEESVNYFDLKGAASHLFKTLRLKESYRENASHPYFHPKISVKIWMGRDGLGEMGRIHPAVLEAYDLKQDAYLFELNVSALKKVDFKKIVFERLIKFPAVKRDLSLLIPLERDIVFNHLVETIENAGGALLTQTELFDIYEGPSIPAGFRSYTFALTYQSAERTLTDAEVNHCHEQICRTLSEKYETKIR